MEFKNKNILIIGGSSDIGLALINDLILLQCNIYFTCKTRDRIEEVTPKIKTNNSSKCVGYSLDILKFDTHGIFWNSLEIKPDIVITCVGYLDDINISSGNNVELIKSVNSNYVGLINLLNIVSKDFKKNKSGIIVGISSVAGERGRGSNYVYGSSKAGFTTYLSGLRNSLFKHNVRVITVKPGPVKTKMTNNIKISKLLSSSPYVVSSHIIRSIRKNKDVVYIKWYWRWIILIIKFIPENIFKRLDI